MPDFEQATRVEGGDGRYRGALAPDWFVWGPMGGYVAAIAFRALDRTSAQPRPATFACQFLRAGSAGPVEVEVEVVRGGRRSEALRATLSQEGTPLLSASAWFVAEAFDGFEHRLGEMPKVPPPEALRPYSELSEDYASWFPIWQHLEGRPVRWEYAPGPPVWHTWMRLLAGAPADPVVDTARTLLWADLLPWNAAQAPHDWPRRFIAPNLDLTLQFHAQLPGEDWMLCDAESQIAREGLVGTGGRLWTRDGRLVASATAQLFCVPNPRYAEELETRRRIDAERAEASR
jgi:acyl-CoA thioesterase-2